MAVDTFSILADLQRTQPIATAIATSLLEQARVKGKALPSAADLAAAISSVSPESHMQGADVVKIVIHDESFRLMDSGFFDPPTLKGMLGDFDLNYPDGSRYWWRLSSYNPQADGTATLTFINRAVAKLMNLYGPLKATRGQMTRAQFLKMVAGHVPEIEFFSQQLDVVQPLDSATGKLKTPKVSLTTTRQTSNKSHGKKRAGLGQNTARLTVKGSPISAEQIHVANTAIAVGHQLNAPSEAMIAIIYAGMGESSLGSDSTTYTSGVAYGPWQTLPGKYNNGRDWVAAANDFFQGGGSFAAVGAIAHANQGHPAWMIANETEVNKVWLNSRGDSYQGQFPGGQAQGIAEAVAIIQAAGGSTLPGGVGGGVVIDQQAYTYEIGTASNPTETLWDGMVRLAQEVNWELFMDGDRMYYDHEFTLIRQKPELMVGRDDSSVVDWNYQVEMRNIATQKQLVLICEPFAYHAGEVIQLDETFGPAGVASVAGLPGRWLIADSTAVDGQLTTTYTLKQPTQPKPEPAATQSSVNAGLNPTNPAWATTNATGAVAKAFAAAQQLSNLGRPYSKNTRQLTDPPPPGLDCSSSTAWVLWKAGLYQGPLGNAWVSGEFQAQWGVPGRGRYMTIWASPTHVFIEFNLPGSHWQMNTVNPGSVGPRLEPWSYSNQDAGDGAAAFMTPKHWPGT